MAQGQALEIIGSRAHGHVHAVAVAMQRLGFASLLGSQPSRERERKLVLAMVAARIVAPHTKLATTRWWHTTSLAEDFGVADANEDDLYAAMDWLLADDPGHRREGLGVVDGGGLAIQAEAGRERRLEARLALLAFERFEQRAYQVLLARESMGHEAPLQARREACAATAAQGRFPDHADHLFRREALGEDLRSAL